MTRLLKDYPPGGGPYDKADVTEEFTDYFDLSVARSVYFNDRIAFRFSHVSGTSFSNTILGLSTLRQYDDRPFCVLAVGPDFVNCLLANSTFLRKISHSSHQLRVDNVRGSFLGHDIMKDYEGLPNTPANFEELFLIHQEYTWEENLARLVDATDAIAGTGKKFVLSPAGFDALKEAPNVASIVARSDAYHAVKRKLDAIVRERRDAILQASLIDNVNLRGNRIEQIISDATNQHGLEDLQFRLPEGHLVLVDVKTKMLDLQSNPKGYNVDKVLAMLTNGATTMSYYLIGIDRVQKNIYTSLVSILDSSLLDATRIQFHWAGRNSRGVTQLSSDLSAIFSSRFREEIDVPKARAFLLSLADL